MRIETPWLLMLIVDRLMNALIGKVQFADEDRTLLYDHVHFFVHEAVHPKRNESAIKVSTILWYATPFKRTS